MNKKQFSKYLSDSFGISPEAAGSVITIFSEGVNEALSEGYNIKIDNFCIKPANAATSKFKTLS
jgi:nucleoid DNA-binding protein